MDRFHATSLRRGVSFAAFLVSSAAWAQTHSPASDSEQNAAATGSAARAASVTSTPAEAAAAPDIVVTAQRRSQNLQDVPISITAISGETAQRLGVRNTDTLATATPGLDFSRQVGNGAAPYLRGVGSTSVVAGAETPVAIYVDDVYIGAGIGNLLQFNNISQVAVLKGPQGTLFGRNATGGVIQVTTRPPSHETSLDARVGYGNYDTLDGSLYATTGLSSTLAVDIAFLGHDQQNGYGFNLTANQRTLREWNWGVRSSLLWQPDSRTTFRLIGDYGKFYSELGVNVTVNPGSISSGGGTFVGDYRSLGNIVDFSRGKQGGVSLRAEHDFDLVKLISITAYRHIDYFFLFDQDAGPKPVTISSTTSFTNTFSQEVQLQSAHNGPFNWILGGFYLRTRAGFDPLRPITPTATGAAAFGDTNDAQVLHSYSGFAEINYEFVPRARITLGLRYTTDDYHFNVVRTDGLGNVITGGIFSQQASFSKLTYRAILDYHFSRDIMAYASYSRGFKSGGFNVAAPGVSPGNAPVSPEVLDAYEVGLRTQLFDRRLTFNISAFHYNYSNLQVTIIGPSTSFVVNAAAARINGMDFEATFRPSSRFQISAGGSFLDGNYTRFPNGPLNVPKPAVCTPLPTTTGARTGGNLTCASDLSGNTTIRTPRFTGNISLLYTIPTSVGDFDFAGNVYHNSGFFWEPDNRTTQAPYDLVNTSLTWRSTNHRFEASVWARNLFNQYYVAFGSESALRDSQSPAPPRMYGFTLGVHL